MNRKLLFKFTPHELLRLKVLARWYKRLSPRSPTARRIRAQMGNIINAAQAAPELELRIRR